MAKNSPSPGHMTSIKIYIETPKISETIRRRQVQFEEVVRELVTWQHGQKKTMVTMETMETRVTMVTMKTRVPWRPR